MTLRTNVDSNSNVVYNKFWTKSIMEDTDEDTSNSQDKQQLSTSPSSKTKRHQAKMLLASLIEHFCRAYGDTPDANRKVFFLICQTLRSLGIIDAEFVDEMTSVRSTFQHAFHKLFFTAVQTVRNQDLIHFDDNLPIIKPSSIDLGEPISSCSSSSDSMDYFSSPQSHTSKLSSSFSSTNKLSTSALSGSSLHSFIAGDGDIFHNLSVQNSRYKNDFIEIGLLGKGGFASAFRARNKLDGIYYAVKKIRLGNDIKECDNSKDNPYEKIFREIKNLARLEHHNVIRYYSSWLEFDDEDANLSSDDSDWEEDPSTPYSPHPVHPHSDDENSIFRGIDPTFSDHSDASWNINDDTSGLSLIQFGECSTSGYYAGSNDCSTGGSSPWSTPLVGSASTSQSSKYAKKSMSKSGWTLFIQMQLCPTTLHDYIRFRNKQYAEELSYNVVDTRRNIEIFAQILEGTAYIHDQGLIHRDLKPSNIFLSMSNTTHYVNDDGKRRRRRVSSAGPCLESFKLSGGDSSTHSSPESCPFPRFSFENQMWEEHWVPKIGDFGLAAEVMDENEGVLVPTPRSSTPPSPKIGPLRENNNIVNDTVKKLKRPQPRRTRTIGVGTRTYASPEQLAIPAQAYDEKVDIYSLGIILFELFQPFATGMERADSIEKLKRGVFPNGFLELYPKVTALIIWMMDKNPRHRPSARQLLDFELFAHPSSSQDDNDLCLSLKTQLQSKINLLERKNKEIDDLKSKLEQAQLEKQIELGEMQRRLEEMQLKLNQYEHNTEKTPVKKGILTPTSSFLKRKKEVRWSALD